MSLNHYCSARGAEELDAIRVGGKPKPVGAYPPIELLARLPSEECGCPEELWKIEGLLYLIHMEEQDGTGEIFIYAGDWEAEQAVDADTLEDLRAKMFEKHAQIMRTTDQPAKQITGV